MGKSISRFIPERERAKAKAAERMNGTSAGKKDREDSGQGGTLSFTLSDFFVLAQRLPTTLLHREHEKNGGTSLFQGTRNRIESEREGCSLFQRSCVTLSAESFVTDNGRSDNFT